MIITDEIDFKSNGLSMYLKVGDLSSSFNFTLPSSSGSTGQVLVLTDDIGTTGWGSAANSISISAQPFLAVTQSGSAFTFGATSTGTGTIVALQESPSLSHPYVSTTSASQAVFTNSSKELVSNAITGTGNVVMSNAPSLSGALTSTGSITANNGFSTNGTDFFYYAKGTFTPTLVFKGGGNSTSPTSYTTRVGTYQLLGNLCTITCDVKAIMPIISPTGQFLFITGLPYKCKSSTSGLSFSSDVVNSQFAKGPPPVPIPPFLGDTTIGYTPAPYFAIVYEEGQVISLDHAAAHYEDYTMTGYELVFEGSTQVWVNGFSQTYQNVLDSYFYLLVADQGAGGEFSITYLTDGTPHP